uniref:SFRICE_022363 n=1 Tax=Spodoptera frugiperda TaxID=7108 RepID=A0A2H1VXQ7_SPOFR
MDSTLDPTGQPHGNILNPISDETRCVAEDAGYSLAPVRGRPPPVEREGSPPATDDHSSPVNTKNKMKGGRVGKVIGWKSADSRAACNPEMYTHRNNTNVFHRNIANRCRYSLDDTQIQFKTTEKALPVGYVTYKLFMTTAALVLSVLVDDPSSHEMTIMLKREPRPSASHLFITLIIHHPSSNIHHPTSITQHPSSIIIHFHSLSHFI